MSRLTAWWTKIRVWSWRGISALVWLALHPPTGRHVRKLLGLIFMVMSLARLGLFTYGGGGQFLKPELYGLLLLAASLWLLLTIGTRGLYRGRVGAAYAAALCGGMATDLVLHGGSTTSAANLVIFAWCLLGAAGSSHDLD